MPQTIFPTKHPARREDFFGFGEPVVEGSRGEYYRDPGENITGIQEKILQGSRGEYYRHPMENITGIQGRILQGSRRKYYISEDSHDLVESYSNMMLLKRMKNKYLRRPSGHVPRSCSSRVALIQPSPSGTHRPISRQ